MKRICILMSLVLSSVVSFGQTNTFPTDGNVGVGTASPAYKLDVLGSFRFGGSGGYSSMLMGVEGSSLPGYNQTNYMLPITVPGSGTARTAFRFKNNVYEPGQNLLDVIVDGNVGIGTTSPASPLHVIGGSAMTSGWNKTATLSATYPVLIFNSSNAKWAGIGYDYTSNLNFWVNASSDDVNGTGNAVFRISNDGNIGMGHSGMSFKLNVTGEASITNSLNLTSDNQEMRFYRGGSIHGFLWSSSNGLHWGKGHYHTSITVDNSGNMGVGTIDTKGYKLAVAGNMIAESVKVKLQGAWPDYVFAPSYKIPTLQETEQHIKEKGHLQGIPSASEVKANGVDLGDMNAKLLQKIEELTLHLIEQNRKIDMMQREIKNMKEVKK